MKRSKICWSVLSNMLLIHLISDVKIGSAEEEEFHKFSGLHLFSNTTQKVYYHDLTIAVVEIGSNDTLMNCELLHVSNDQQQNETLRYLTVQISKPIAVTFDEMIDKISSCNKLDQDVIADRIAEISYYKFSTLLSRSRNFWYSLWRGIYPGTKWCGVGNIAKSYYDLGSKESMDKCCRAHDFCPVLVTNRRPRYGLSHDSWFTRSHCTCDDKLLDCLRKTDSIFALYLAIIYFEILRIPCIVDEAGGKKRFQSRDWW